MTFGPCTPYVTASVVAASPDACGATAAQLGPYVTQASEILYVLLGRQFPGVCSATVRPLGHPTCWGQGWGWGSWNVGPWGIPSTRLGMWDTSFDFMDPIPLTQPVVSITAVKVDGATLTSGVEYRLRNGYELVRVDGKRWPRSQNMGLADTQPDTFSIAYTFGQALPTAVVAAAVELTLELWKDASSDPAGKLPRDTRGVSRQGMSLTVDRQVERVREAGPALPRVMSALASFNPANQRIPPTVWSPDSEWTLSSFT